MIIGTAGHIDHGKTSLVRALTGVDTDRLKEEKARGITIDLGFAYSAGPGGDVLGFVDVPGHERLVHTMLAGAAGIDFVILVVTADDGPMPQTREHLAIIDLLGLRRGVVALTKTDLVDPDRRAAAEAEIAEALSDTTLAGAEILPVSTLTGDGIEALRAVLDREAQVSIAYPASGRFRLAVDRSFTLSGIGTVVTGTVLSGSVRADDRVVVGPGGVSARVRGLRAQDRVAETGRAGDRCALNLTGDGVTREAIARGDVVLDPTLHAPSDRIDAALRVLPGEPKAIGQWFPVRLHHGSAETGARIVLLDDQPVQPGGSAIVQLVLEHPVAAFAGDRYIVRDTSGQRTIGGGRFLDIRAPTRRRRTPERRAQLDALAQPEASDAVAGLLSCSPFFLELDLFVRDRALAARAAPEIAARLGLVRFATPAGSIVLDGERWADLQHALLGTLDVFHRDNPDLQGMGLERLRLALPVRLPTAAFRSALGRLVAEGQTVVQGSFVRLPAHDVRLTPAEERTWDRTRPRLGDVERFRPPRVRDLSGALDLAEPEMRRVLKLVGRRGEVDEVAHDHFFLRETVTEMAGFVRELSAGSANGLFTAASFRDRMDNGRKVAIQILDFFDRNGVTMRRGDQRRANPHRLDLFGPIALDHVGPVVGDGEERRLW